MVRVLIAAYIREDANGLPVCVAEGSDGTAELQEIISHNFFLLIITNLKKDFFYNYDENHYTLC